MPGVSKQNVAGDARRQSEARKRRKFILAWRHFFPSIFIRVQGRTFDEKGAFYLLLRKHFDFNKIF